jgi:hypothetical protein
MPNALKVVADYLSYEEGMLLGEKLQEADIPFWVKTCGPPAFPFGQGLFYRLLVSEQNATEGEEIAEIFAQECAAKKAILKCPRCRSEEISKAEKLQFWQKIYYAGTQVFNCRNCGKRFSK